MIVITDELTAKVEALIQPLPLEEQLGALVSLLVNALGRTPPANRKAIVAVILMALVDQLRPGEAPPETPGRSLH